MTSDVIDVLKEGLELAFHQLAVLAGALPYIINNVDPRDLEQLIQYYTELFELNLYDIEYSLNFILDMLTFLQEFCEKYSIFIPSNVKVVCDKIIQVLNNFTCFPKKQMNIQNPHIGCYISIM